MSQEEDVPGLISDAEDGDSSGGEAKSNGTAEAAKKTVKKEKKPSPKSQAAPRTSNLPQPPTKAAVKKGGFDVELVRAALSNFKASDSENESPKPRKARQKETKLQQADSAAAGDGSTNPTFISLHAVMKEAQATKEKLEAKLEEAEQLIKTYETEGQSSNLHSELAATARSFGPRFFRRLCGCTNEEFTCLKTLCCTACENTKVTDRAAMMSHLSSDTHTTATKSEPFVPPEAIVNPVGNHIVCGLCDFRIEPADVAAEEFFWIHLLGDDHQKKAKCMWEFYAASDGKEKKDAHPAFVSGS